jgi:hypothetical protein
MKQNLVSLVFTPAEIDDLKAAITRIEQFPSPAGCVPSRLSPGRLLSFRRGPSVGHPPHQECVSQILLH